MHALDARGIDKDFVQRPRQRHGVELAARKLHRNELLRPFVAVELIEIGADRGLHRVDEAAQDAILVEAVDRLQRGFDRAGDESLTRRAFALRHAEMRVEAGVKRSHDLRRDAGVLAQRRPHVILRVGDADLPQKARQRANQRHVAPHQAGREHERVVAVVLGASAHDREEAALEPFLERVEHRTAGPMRFAASCRGTRHRPRRRRAECDRCARRRRGSPCSPAPARARTARSAGCG